MPQQDASPTSHYSLHQSSTTTVTLCSYHMLTSSSASTGYTSNMNPMDRFLSEGSAEQRAMFIRGDNGEPSTKRKCECKRTSKEKL
ncbi:hypothetical protein HBH49_150010 [Parastagonospora nodorum]|nr:hypothetical protein HBH49_150010 [Parastagonospora nodorum]KAH5305822.1 hypothetical protein HBI12_168880 [Parastagonospora nodorum]